LQQAGSAILILFLYLTSNRHANILGMYRLPLDQIGRELKVIPRDALLPAFAVLARLEVAYYDVETEFIWVREMAGQRLHPTAPEQTLAPEDGKRWIAVQRAYGELPANPFLGAFFDHYHARLRLVSRRPGAGLDIDRSGTPYPMGYRIPYPTGYPMATTVDHFKQNDQKADPADDQLADDQTIRRVETVDAVEKSEHTTPSEPSPHSFHAHSPAAERRPTDPAVNEKDRQPDLPLGRLFLVPDPESERTAELEEAIARLVLEQLRLLQTWPSRAALTDAAHELCSKTPGLTRVRRALVDAGIDRALRTGLTFACAPGVRLDVVHENRDTG
jgi:hypothetical protein